MTFSSKSDKTILDPTMRIKALCKLRKIGTKKLQNLRQITYNSLNTEAERNARFQVISY